THGRCVPLSRRGSIGGSPLPAPATAARSAERGSGSSPPPQERARARATASGEGWVASRLFIFAFRLVKSKSRQVALCNVRYKSANGLALLKEKPAKIRVCGPGPPIHSWRFCKKVAGWPSTQSALIIQTHPLFEEIPWP